MAQLDQHRFEPVRVSTGLDADDHVAAQLRVEGADIILLMVYLTHLYLAARSVAIADGLRASMKVNTAIYCHGYLLVRSRNRRESSRALRQEVPTSYHQK